MTAFRLAALLILPPLAMYFLMHDQVMLLAAHLHNGALVLAGMRP